MKLDFHRHRRRIAAVVVALAVVIIGKELYRSASAAELRWILGPTAMLVGWVTGGDFKYEAGPGWVDRDLRFIIAPECAGVHFALAVFLALALGGLAGVSTWRRAALQLGAAAAIAYPAMLLVNTTRIAIAIAIHRGTIDLGDLDPGEVHRIEGVLVYFGGLCAVYAIARGIQSRKLVSARWLAVPLTVYLAITLGLPILNGAARQAEFLRHAAWVAGGCVVVASLALMVTACRWRGVPPCSRSFSLSGSSAAGIRLTSNADRPRPCSRRAEGHPEVGHARQPEA